MVTSSLRSRKLTQYKPLLTGLLIFATLLVFCIWWWATPSGILGKAGAAAYAVCHRIASHSFSIAGQQLPLCARCTGMYLGALLGVLYHLHLGKRGGMPPLKISLVLGAFLLLFAVDGINSYLHFLPGAPALYPPQNWLRLVSGTGVGLGIAAVLMPVANQMFWQNVDLHPALTGWRQFLPLLALAALLDLIVLSQWSFLLYPLALLSASAIFLVLSIVYTLIWTMLFKQENHFQRYRDLLIPWMAGLLVAMVQIGGFDALRFWLTGTWAGLNL